MVNENENVNESGVNDVSNLTEVPVILDNSIIRKIVAGKKLTDEEYAEVVGAFIRATGAIT